MGDLCFPLIPQNAKDKGFFDDHWFLPSVATELQNRSEPCGKDIALASREFLDNVYSLGELYHKMQCRSWKYESIPVANR